MPTIDISLGLPEVPQIKDPIYFKKYAEVYSVLKAMAESIFPPQTMETEKSRIGFSRVDLHRYGTVFIKAGRDIEAMRVVSVIDYNGAAAVVYPGEAVRKFRFGVTLTSAAAGEWVAVRIAGIIGNLSGLKTGTTYLANDTGQIASIWDIPAEANIGNLLRTGLALSQTDLLVGATAGNSLGWLIYYRRNSGLVYG